MLILLQREDDEVVQCIVAGVVVKMHIDSGSPINTITTGLWNKIKLLNRNLKKVKPDESIIYKGYANSASIEVEGIFEAQIMIREKQTKTIAKFHIVRGASKSLLSKDTAKILKVLKLGLEVKKIEENRPFPLIPNICVKFLIDKTVIPKKILYHSVPAALEEKVQQKLDILEKQDIIEKVTFSDWISPMQVVPKGQDDVRICINMKGPNEAILREHYPLPVFDTFINKLRGSKWFTKLDITNAYHHVLLHPESRELTTFMASRGLMRFKRLMFGVNCAPEQFQKIMEEILLGCKGVINFLDDILIYGSTVEDHDSKCQEVMKRLKNNNILLNEKKCVHKVKKLEFLGHEVTERGILITEAKKKAIMNFREPETKEEVRSFLGLITFVGHFVNDLATKTEPLRKVIRDESDGWKEEQKEAFFALKKELIDNTNVLGYYDIKDETILYTDASPVGLGAVLVQRGRADGFHRIISYASKSLTSAERRYSQIQREALAVVWGVEHYYYYLFGKSFILRVDSKPLKFIFEGRENVTKRACTRAESWALRLQPYRFSIEHIPGKENIADSLSRLCKQTDKPFEDVESIEVCAVEGYLESLKMDEVIEETTKDEEIQLVFKALQDDKWSSDLIRYQAVKQELSKSGNILMRGERVVIPRALREKALEIGHRGHPASDGMKRTLRAHVWWPKMENDIVEHVAHCFGCLTVSKPEVPVPMIRTRLPEAPWQLIAIDFFSIPELKACLLGIVDYYSRYLIVKEMKKTDAIHTIDALEEVFKIWSYPCKLKADNGPPFDSKMFKEYCLDSNIQLENTIPYWPQMNGEIERQNRELTRALKIAKVEKVPWREALIKYVSL